MFFLFHTPIKYGFSTNQSSHTGSYLYDKYIALNLGNMGSFLMKVDALLFLAIFTHIKLFL